MSKAELVDFVQKMEDIQSRINAIESKKAKLKKQYQSDLIKLIADQAKAENICGHWCITYHGDPSGGSDSHETCDVCGKILDRKEYRRS